MEIKTNHMVVITPKMNLLQIPIKDKFYVPPSDPAAAPRTTEFAQEKGLLNPRKGVTPKEPAKSNRPPAKRVDTASALAVSG
jgi:glutamine amidotransferase